MANGGTMSNVTPKLRCWGATSGCRKGMPGVPPANAAAQRSGVHIRGESWSVEAQVRIDYHVHTNYSYDSDAAPESVIARALEVGLDAICVTDHGTIEGALALKRVAPPELEVVVGCELDAADGTQVIGLGLNTPPPVLPIFDLFSDIKRQGGLILLPHPFRRGSGVFRPERKPSDSYIIDVLEAADLVECFNGRDSYDNNQRNRDLRARGHAAAVAGSDAHTVLEIGSVHVEYRGAAAVHGGIPRDIWYPDQEPRIEGRTKKTVMELYHRHERQLPTALGSTYRHVRRALGKERPPRQASARRQLTFDVARAPSRSHDG